MFLDGVVFRRHDHFEKGRSRGVFDKRHLIPQFIDLTEHQAIDRPGEYHSSAELRDDLRDLGAVAQIGFEAAQMRVATIRIGSVLAELQEVDHDDRAVLVRTGIGEKALQLLVARAHRILDFHISLFRRPAVGLTTGWTFLY